MNTEELEEVTKMLTEVQSKIRSSKNWEEDSISWSLVSKIWRIKKDIVWYEEEKYIVEQNRKPEQPSFRWYNTDRQYATTYDPWLPASETNQPSYT